MSTDILQAYILAPPSESISRYSRTGGTPSFFILSFIRCVAKAVMPGNTPMAFGMPRLPVSTPIMLIFMLVLATGAISRWSTRSLRTMSIPQKVKKIVTSMPLPSAAQPMISAG